MKPSQTIAFSRLVILAVAALVLLTSRAAAQQQQLGVQIAGLSAATSTSADVVVSVVDAQGTPRTDLTPQDFQAWLNESAVPVTTVSRAVDSSQAIAVVLAIDTSGSMAEGGALEQAKVAARSFIAGLAPQDTVAIVTFADAPSTVLPFTQDRTAAELAINALNASGTTALYQATSASLDLAAASETRRRAVVLLSDGGLGVLVDQDGPAKSDALASAESLGVPVFSIGLGADVDRGYLTQLSQLSGGQFAETPSPEGLVQLYQTVGELLRGQYILGLDTSAAGAGDAISTLRIQVTSAGATGSAAREVCLQPLCLALANVVEGESLTEARELEAKVISTKPVVSVAFVVDGERVSTLTAPPYRITVDPASLDDGDHTIVVEVTTASGLAQTPDLTVTTGQATAGGGGFNTILLVPAVVAACILVAFLALRRFKNRSHEKKNDPALLNAELRPLARTSEANGESTDLAMPERTALAPQPTIERALGQLIATQGPLAGQTFDVGSQPVSVGSGTRCQVRLPEDALDNPEVKPEHARIWIRDGHLMVHELRRLTALGPVGGGWEILSPNDEFVIGNCTFKFQLFDQDTQPHLEAPSPAPVQTLRTVPRTEGKLFPVSPLPEPPVASNEGLQTFGALALAPQPAPDTVAAPPPPPEAPHVEPMPSLQPVPFPETPSFQVDDGIASEADEATDTPEQSVPNILRDRAGDATDGPFAPAQPPSPPEDIPNILRDRPREQTEEDSETSQDSGWPIEPPDRP